MIINHNTVVGCGGSHRSGHTTYLLWKEVLSHGWFNFLALQRKSDKTDHGQAFYLFKLTVQQKISTIGY